MALLSLSDSIVVAQRILPSPVSSVNLSGSSAKVAVYRPGSLEDILLVKLVMHLVYRIGHRMRVQLFATSLEPSNHGFAQLLVFRGFRCVRGFLIHVDRVGEILILSLVFIITLLGRAPSRRIAEAPRRSQNSSQNSFTAGLAGLQIQSRSALPATLPTTCMCVSAKVWVKVAMYQFLLLGRGAPLILRHLH